MSGDDHPQPVRWVKPPQPPMAIHLKRDLPGDGPALRAWAEYLRKEGREDLAGAIETHGEATVAHRWPKKNSPLPRVKPDTGRRVTGETG